MDVTSNNPSNNLGENGPQRATAEFSSSNDRRPPRRDQITIVAALDAIGLVVTIIAAVLFANTDVTRTGRWVVLVALAAAAVTGIVTTVTLVGLLARRRAYVRNMEKVALRLESHRGLRPSPSYFEHAEDLRDEAIEFGEESLAARLDAAIAVAERRLGKGITHMSDQLQVGWIAGCAQVIAALVALFGVLFTAVSTNSAKENANATPTSVVTAPANTLSCMDVVERYRSLMLQDPALLAALTTPGPDGISPIEADPDARRCGISATTLRSMR